MADDANPSKTSTVNNMADDAGRPTSKRRNVNNIADYASPSKRRVVSVCRRQPRLDMLQYQICVAAFYMMHVWNIIVAIMQKRKRRWVREIFQRRKLFGVYHHLVQEITLADHHAFINYFRMTPSLLEQLITQVGPKIQKQLTFFRETISAKERLCVTLRYLATGESMRSLSFAYRIGYTTTSRIIKETCQVLWEVLQPTYMPQPTCEAWIQIASDFETMWNFPLCVGALDGKHVAIQAPNNSGSVNYNYKGFHSRVLMAMCNARYHFTMIDVGAPGRQNDSTTFQASAFGQQLRLGEHNLPPDGILKGTTQASPYVIVADEAFPLRNYLMRPFPGNQLTIYRRVFNYRLSRARRTIENAFGILSNRWRIFRSPIIASETNIDCFIRAACCLHNYVMINMQTSYCPRDFADAVNIQGQVTPGTWRTEETTLGNIRLGGGYRGGLPAEQIRERLSMYFCTVSGEVQWQYQHINMNL